MQCTIPLFLIFVVVEITIRKQTWSIIEKLARHRQWSPRYGPTRPKQLSVIGTGRVIWLCECVRCWPYRGVVYPCSLNCGGLMLLPYVPVGIVMGSYWDVSLGLLIPQWDCKVEPPLWNPVNTDTVECREIVRITEREYPGVSVLSGLISFSKTKPAATRAFFCLHRRCDFSKMVHRQRTVSERLNESLFAKILLRILLFLLFFAQNFC